VRLESLSPGKNCFQIPVDWESPCDNNGKVGRCGLK
jgi:hypothetical protein